MILPSSATLPSRSCSSARSARWPTSFSGHPPSRRTSSAPRRPPTPPWVTTSTWPRARWSPRSARSASSPWTSAASFPLGAAESTSCAPPRAGRPAWCTCSRPSDRWWPPCCRLWPPSPGSAPRRSARSPGARWRPSTSSRGWCASCTTTPSPRPAPCATSSSPTATPTPPAWPPTWWSSPTPAPRASASGASPPPGPFTSRRPSRPSPRSCCGPRARPTSTPWSSRPPPRVLSSGCGRCSLDSALPPHPTCTWSSTTPPRPRGSAAFRPPCPPHAVSWLTWPTPSCSTAPSSQLHSWRGRPIPRRTRCPAPRRARPRTARRRWRWRAGFAARAPPACGSRRRRPPGRGGRAPCPRSDLGDPPIDACFLRAQRPRRVHRVHGRLPRGHRTARGPLLRRVRLPLRHVLCLHPGRGPPHRGDVPRRRGRVPPHGLRRQRRPRGPPRPPGPRAGPRWPPPRLRAPDPRRRHASVHVLHARGHRVGGAPHSPPVRAQPRGGGPLLRPRREPAPGRVLRPGRRPPLHHG
mmetsp:Transcript_16436/g.55860  ORF Transcript_16436/g.55860 Transcript_16436/m.55860 type:complete len:524 (+) Transcript_16436:476-2047(+)